MTNSPSSGQPLSFPKIHKVWSGGRYYIYAWRGGPRVAAIKADTKAEAIAKLGETDTAARIAKKLVALTHPRPAPKTIAGLIADYKASASFKGMADSTRKQWHTHLDHIHRVFGATTLTAIQKRGSRALIKRWHEKMGKTPRKANIALTVLTRLFNWALDEERMERNPAQGIARLREGESRADVTWSAAEIEALCEETDAHFANTIRFLYLTGLRRGDAIRLTWTEVDREARLIRRAANKSNKRQTARIFIDDDLAKVLDALPRTAVTVLTTKLGKSYSSADSLSKSFNGVRDRVGIEGKRLHDLRGTRVTLDFANGMSDVDAEAKFGWAPGQGGKMRAKYADADQIALARAEKFYSQK